ncbi:1-deoxy-D-xylulose-5-phosphate reductoisomerase [Dentiradicibacter hellwigii]|uniref:1-deoxy-D-xylulose 5-phosphate reductoisomerase n=1 Tax=Dentiradicibacter hellwigii TaxID=3149053 RepID=A0ABV4UD01_9RHOO
MTYRQLARLTILGSTGSIGLNTLDVVRRHPERYRIAALCAHTQIDRLFEQCLEFRPDFAVVRDDELAAELATRLAAAGCAGIRVEYGAEALTRMAGLKEVDSVMVAIVGAAGLPPALAAAQAGKRVLLANKESLVMAGALFMRTVRESGAVLLPVDSEHNAIFQSLPRDYSSNLSAHGVVSLLLTASGGPFRGMDQAALARVTPEQACAHPKWAMGRKISVDSATLMNKGLEVIEAHWLFNIPPEKIEVVVHPQSIIHSLVRYVDGSVLAELGNPDMRTPIAHALAYPERIDSGVTALDLFSVGALSFERPDVERFPCLGLAYRALKLGGSGPAILNAANEVAVAAFLDRRISFNAIPAIIAAALDTLPVKAVDTLADALAADAQARGFAEQVITERRYA